MNDSNIAASILEENIYEELEDATEQVDEIINGIATVQNQSQKAFAPFYVSDLPGTRIRKKNLKKGAPDSTEMMQSRELECKPQNNRTFKQLKEDWNGV